MTNPRLVSRRELLAAGATIVGAAALGMWPLEGLRADAADDIDQYTLTVGYSERFLAGFHLKTRTYNGSLPGPLIVTRPGRKLRIAVTNTLPPDQTEHPAVNVDPENNPNDFNTTNLHMHGMQIVPHLFAPIGTSDPKARMIALNGGQSLNYDFQLPDDHPSGLYWYHPHHHGSATVQVGGGMAGLVLVKGPIDEVPEIKVARDELLAIQNPKLNKLADGKWGWEPLEYKEADEGGFAFMTEIELLTVNGEPALVIDRRQKRPQTIRGALKTYQMKPGEVMRLRILNGTDGIPMQLVIPGLEVYAIGQDGVNFLKPEPVGADLRSAIRMAPGNRVELLIRAPLKPIKTKLKTLPHMESAPTVLSEAMGEMMAMPTIELAEFIVAGTPTAMAIPSQLPVPTREYPLIKDHEIAMRRTITFTMRIPSRTILTGIEFLINNRLYEETRVDTNVRLGTAEEWTLVNKSDGIHPFHMHVNSFEVIGTPWDRNYHRIHDTIWLQPYSQTKIRVRFKEWKGKSVYHCHILPHEDSAMIANFLIT